MCLHFIAKVQVTPLVLTYQLWDLRWLGPTEMPKQVALPKALGSGGSSCTQPCRQSSSAHGGGCGWVHAMGAVGLGLWAACCCWSKAPALWQHQQWESPCSREIAKWIWQKQKHSMLNMLS